MRSTIVGLSLVLLLAACATYTENGLFGGYREVPLAADTYRISSKGNDLTTKSKTNAIALVRAADLAIENGYTRLEISNYNEWTKTKTFELPSSSTTYFHVNSYSNSGYATTYHSPRPTITEEHPRTDLVVRFVSDTSPRASNALTVNQLIAKYGPVAGLSDTQMAEMLSRVETLAISHPETEYQEVNVTSGASNKKQAEATVPPQRNVSRELMLEERYELLSEDDKFIADTLSPTERVQFIYSKSR